MNRTRFRLHCAALRLVAVLGFALTALAQSGPTGPGGPAGPGGTGVSREAMWFAPTAEDWKKPCLITWQRSMEDALVVSRETGKPILVCVNMDGEIASEHYAGVRYRQPEIAALYERYVNVIASVYRHTPSDYDEQGRRILCPRFGSVTCGEHIAIEPGLHDKYFDGQRVAPRHVGVELDGKETFDVFYAWDTDSVFAAIKKGVEGRAELPPVARGDRPLVERVASRDVRDRSAVEQAYLGGDVAQRRTILQAAIAQGASAPLEVLRLAVRGFDVELAQLARRALAAASDPAAVDLIADALRAPTDVAERDALIAALVRIGATSPRARSLATVHQGLLARSGTIDEERWARALVENPGASTAASDQYALNAKLAEHADTLRARPDDRAAQLDLAEATLAVATERVASHKPMPFDSTRKFASLLFEDAHASAIEAERLGATGWRVNAAVSVAAYYLGKLDEAYARAEAAMGDLPADASSWSAMAVLGIFAEARQQAILRAVRTKAEWPAQWLADANEAYDVLSRHPLGNDLQVAAHYDFLKQLAATGQAAHVLDAGLARFRDSAALHARLRSKILEEGGLDRLEATYDAMLKGLDATPNLEWFAGYASLVTAEFRRRAGKRDDATLAYDRAVGHFERCSTGNPASRESCDHYIAMAFAGRARVAFERGDYERAHAELLASFERRPQAAASLDGLNVSAVTTSQLVLAKLKETQRADLAASLDAALSKLDPEDLLPPEYDRQTPERRGGNRPPRDRQPSGG